MGLDEEMVMMRLSLNAVLGLLLVAFTVPAMAELKLGSRIFVDCYYLDRNKENVAWRGLGNNRFTKTGELPVQVWKCAQSTKNGNPSRAQRISDRLVIYCPALLVRICMFLPIYPHSCIQEYILYA
jgi:hypothetical protein